MKIFTPNTVIASADVNLNFDELNTRMTAIDAGIEMGAWKEYVPVTTNITKGTGYILTGRYIQIGKTVTASVYFKFGTGGSGAGLLFISLPFTAANQGVAYYGSAKGLDSGTSHLIAIPKVAPNANFVRFYINGGSEWGTTVPHTWAVNDEIEFTITYEVA